MKAPTVHPYSPTRQQGPVYAQLRERLCRIRENAQLSQRVLSIRLGRDPSYVYKCEQGKRWMDAIEVLDWARACVRDPMELVRFVDREMSAHKR